MAAKKPFTFTAVSYIVEKSGGGSVRPRAETVFEQEKSPRGTCAFRPVRRTVCLPEAEQAAYDRRMMRRAGDILSDSPACGRGPAQ